MAFFLEPLLAAHDREHVEVFLYSDVGASVADRRVKIVAAEVKGEHGVIHSMRHRLAHHEFLHAHVLTCRLAAIARKEIFPRFGVEVDAAEAKLFHLCDPAPHGFAIRIERFEEIPEPDAEHG